MAVYTDVAAEDLIVFLDDYDLGGLLSLKGIAEGVENSNYFVMTDAGPHILTLYEKRVNADDLPFFLGLMDHLAQRGVPCPTPIKDRNGTALKELNGRPAVLISFLNGVSPRRATVEHCAGVGRAMADLHLKGADFSIRRENSLSVAGWRELALGCHGQADEIEPGLCDEIAAEIALMETCWPHDLPAGVIHADLFCDNVFFEGNTLSGLIDFYFACNDLFAYDVAIALNAWCFESAKEFNVTKARALLHAYRQVRPFEAAEIEALPLLARGAALRFLLTRLFDWLNPVDGALVTPKNPHEYLSRMRFHRGVESAVAYGLLDT
ncbi:MAG: homoserine kinase [Alphaproteobacteria bacterium]|jgi:homoserine kinase type II|nr:homoserine kinase [Rhodospirillaceae bacterium]MBT6509559.1 homoserine kinase [Rhodospirillaceae bacterium]MBT7611620.1 homoserine kinase [Rhodospirillaceae bacterium]MBT7647730.1 homoserine kinase [Rhodospirillaceae bacterium]MDG2479369.1 homoserine kinase [Alphaproteobacteria bacterium]